MIEPKRSEDDITDYWHLMNSAPDTHLKKILKYNKTVDKAVEGKFSSEIAAHKSTSNIVTRLFFSNRMEKKVANGIALVDGRDRAPDQRSEEQLG